MMSLDERTKDKPIHSIGCVKTNSKSTRSFFVKQGCEIFVFGKLTPLLEESGPPCRTLAFTTYLPPLYLQNRVCLLK